MSSILNPAERRHVRIIRSLLDLYESQGQVHVTELIEREAHELANTANAANAERARAMDASAADALRAFAKNTPTKGDT
jgi:hypothetical protein